MSQAPVDPQNRGSQPAASNVEVRPSVVILLFGLWTLFVWGGRLRNLWLDPGGLAEAGRWSLVGSVAFTGLGLAVVAVWSTRRFGGVPGPGGLPLTALYRAVLGALAALTVVVWLIRGVDIALGDHAVGFIVVHVVLALVSVGLAMAALRRLSVG